MQNDGFIRINLLLRPDGLNGKRPKCFKTLFKGQLQVWDEKFLLDEIIGIYILMQNKKLSFYLGSSQYINIYIPVDDNCWYKNTG